MRQRLVIIVFLFLAFEIFVLNNQISLWDQDEAAYAGFAKNMIQTNDFIIPKYTWSEIHRKTPLHFWLIALAYKIFGINEFSVRFFSDLAILGTFALMFFYGRKFWNFNVAILSVIVLGSSLFVPFLGKMALTDGTLLFFYTLAAFSFFHFIEYQDKKHLFLFWFSVSVGLLIKGPAIAIFVGLLFLIALIVYPNRKKVINLHPWFYGWFSLIPLLIWGYLAWQKDSQFIKWLIDWYILKRVNSYVLGQTGPFGYYFGTFILFFASFITFLFSGFFKAIFNLKNSDSKYFILGIWLLAGWFFYEFLKSKLPSYVLAAHPAIAILIAIELDNFLNKHRLSLTQKISLVFQFIISVLVSLAVYISAKKLNIKLSPIIWIFIGWSFVNLVLLIKGFLNLKRFFNILIINALLFAILNFTITISTIEKYRNATKQVAHYIAQKTDNKTTVVIQNTNGKPPSLPFYIETISKRNFIIQTNLDTLLSLYKSQNHYVFVLDKKTKDIFFNSFCNIAYKEIKSLSTDRKQIKNYYIIKNYINE